jgi:hypothetical protein
MWLLWEPAGSNGMALSGATPAPLGYIAWSAHGEATGDGVGDFAVDQVTSSVNKGTFSASSSYPTWAAVVPSPQNVSCGGVATDAGSAAPARAPRRPWRLTLKGPFGSRPLGRGPAGALTLRRRGGPR